MKLYRNAKILTCNAQNEVINNGHLVVEGNTIRAVLREDTGEFPQAESVDLTGKTIVPGLINSHIHMSLRRSFGSVSGSHKDPASLAYRVIRTCLTSLREGVTTTRDMGHKDGMHVQLRDAIEQRIISGPRIKAAGDAIVMSFGHAHFFCHQVNNTDEMIMEIRRQINNGVDFIKIIASHDDLWHLSGAEICKPWFSLSDLTAAAELAHLGESKITAHANGGATIHRVIEAGFDCIEHGIFLDEEAAVRMKEKGMFLVPTLSGYRQNSDSFWNRGENWTNRYAHLWEAHRESVRYAVKHRVDLAAGTDTLGGIVEEIELLNEAGLSSMEAIRAGTINGARLMDMDREIGSIEAGKLADFLILDEDPSEDVANLRSVRVTVKDGTEFAREELDKFIPESVHYAPGS